MRDARKLSQETMRNIRQNLFFSFLFNGIGVPVAAGVLLSRRRHPAIADVRRRGDGAVVADGCAQCFAAAQDEALIEQEPAHQVVSRLMVVSKSGRAAAGLFLRD